MKKRNETDSLDELIILYEQKQNSELSLLKEQFHEAYESLKPINLIKNLVHEVTTSTEIKNDIATNAINIVIGLLSKQLLIKDSHSPVKKTIVTIAQFAIATWISKHSTTIKAIGSSLLKQLFNKK